jgi:hypothetical protein
MKGALWLSVTSPLLKPSWLDGAATRTTPATFYCALEQRFGQLMEDVVSTAQLKT